MPLVPNYEEYNCPEHGPSGTDYCPECAEADAARLTEEELAEFEQVCAGQVRENDGTTWSPSGDTGLRLLAEVRRLRRLLGGIEVEIGTHRLKQIEVETDIAWREHLTRAKEKRKI